MNSTETHMNPNFPNQRGCFIDKRNADNIMVVDYPTWSAKNGKLSFGEMNIPIDDGKPFEKHVNSIREAYEFAASEHYAVCNDPWTKPKSEKRRDTDDEYED